MIAGSLESLKRRIAHDRRIAEKCFHIIADDHWQYFQKSSDRERSYGNQALVFLLRVCMFNVAIDLTGVKNISCVPHKLQIAKCAVVFNDTLDKHVLKKSNPLYFTFFKNCPV